MLTKMTEEDWVLVHEVFDACRSRRGGTREGTTARGFEALHYFTVHNITWRALPAEFGLGNSILELLLALEPQRRVRTFSKRFLERASASRADVRLDRHPRACVGGGRKRGQDGEALGRSRGGFSTDIHLKTDLDGYPIGFHLTGGEASESSNFEVLATSAPMLIPARCRDKGYDAVIKSGGAVNAAGLSEVDSSLEHHRQAEVLRKGPLQSAGAYRTNDGQDQALQTHRAPLREDGNKLCLIPRTRLRLHLDQIRPHGLGLFLHVPSWHDLIHSLPAISTDRLGLQVITYRPDKVGEWAVKRDRCVRALARQMGKHVCKLVF